MTSAAGTHARWSTACCMCSVSGSRHQNKEWPGYSRLVRRSKRGRAGCAAEQQTKRTEIEQAQSPRYIRSRHGMQHVKLQFSATENGQATADEGSTTGKTCCMYWIILQSLKILILAVLEHSIISQRTCSLTVKNVVWGSHKKKCKKCCVRVTQKFV